MMNHVRAFSAGPGCYIVIIGHKVELDPMEDVYAFGAPGLHFEWLIRFDQQIIPW